MIREALLQEIHNPPKEEGVATKFCRTCKKTVHPTPAARHSETTQTQPEHACVCGRGLQRSTIGERTNAAICARSAAHRAERRTKWTSRRTRRRTSRRTSRRTRSRSKPEQSLPVQLPSGKLVHWSLDPLHTVVYFVWDNCVVCVVLFDVGIFEWCVCLWVKCVWGCAVLSTVHG